METIGDLRELITKNDGTLKIGALEFRYACKEDENDELNDVDVYLEDEMIMWIQGRNHGNTKLSGGDLEFTVSGDIRESKKILREERSASKKLEEAEKKMSEAATAIGKVEAYEKLLVGREITIGK
jgi:hypothetical protein